MLKNITERHVAGTTDEARTVTSYRIVIRLTSLFLVVLTILGTGLAYGAELPLWDRLIVAAWKKGSIGDLVSAEKLADLSLAEAKRFGPDNYRVGRSLGFLSGVYYHQGRFELAKETVKKAIPIIEKTLGPTTIELIGPLQTLANSYSNEGNYETACSLCNRSIALAEKFHPPALPDALVTYEDILLRMGRTDEAQKVKARLSTVAPTRLRTWDGTFRQGWLECSVAAWAQAEKTLKIAVDFALKEGTTGNDNHVGHSLALLSGIYFHQGKFEQCRATAARALPIYERATPAQKCDFLSIVAYLAKSNAKLNDNDRALYFFNRLFAAAQACKDKGAAAIAMSLDDYRIMLIAMGKLNNYKQAMVQVPAAAIKELVTPKASRGPHVISFPRSYSIGHVYALQGSGERLLGDASGLVNVDLAVPLELHVIGADLKENTQSLSAIPTDEFWTISFASSNISDEGMPCFGKLTGVHEVDLHGTKVGDKGLACLSPLKSIYILNLARTHVTVAGLAKLAANFEPITQLDLSNTEVDYKVSDELKKLLLLTGLSLAGTKVTDATVQQLAALNHLESLNLSRTPITDEALKSIARLTNLKRLSLSDTKVSNLGLKHLAALKQLENLTLTRTLVNNDGLSYIVQLPALKTLSLDGTKVTARGIPQLKRLSKLRELSLYATEAGLSGKLRKLLPQCVINGI